MPAGTALTGRVALGTSKLSFDPARDREADLAALRSGLDAGATIIDMEQNGRVLTSVSASSSSVTVSYTGP